MAARECIAAESRGSVRREIRIVLKVLGRAGKPRRIGRSIRLVLGFGEAEQSLKD
jgi:hypothetical protein